MIAQKNYILATEGTETTEIKFPEIECLRKGQTEIPQESLKS
jgi:hypothetical protein